MSLQENKQFIQRYFAALNGKPKPPAVIDLYIADADLKQRIRVGEEGFPLYQHEVEEIIAEGDLVSVRGRMRGVHKGTFMGIPPTGKPVDVSIYITFRISGGKIVEHWMLTDNIAVMQQIGAIPVSA